MHIFVMLYVLWVLRYYREGGGELGEKIQGIKKYKLAVAK